MWELTGSRGPHLKASMACPIFSGIAGPGCLIQCKNRWEENSMLEADGAAAQNATISQPGTRIVPGVTDPYLREQLEKRRAVLKTAISSVPTVEAPGGARLVELLQEVDSAVKRMDEGTYGICDACHDTVEKERLIADPLVRLCLDHLKSGDQRALTRP